MLRLKLQNGKEYQVDERNSTFFLNDQKVDFDIKKGESDTFYHIIKNNISYNLEVISWDESRKNIKVKINGAVAEIRISTLSDQLLEKTGFSEMTLSQVTTIKAPMPGLIMDILVSSEMEVKKGDPVLILEAMKMENVIKSPRDGVIGSVEVKKGVSVEKNQLLIRFLK